MDACIRKTPFAYSVEDMLNKDTWDIKKVQDQEEPATKSPDIN